MLFVVSKRLDEQNTAMEQPEENDENFSKLEMQGTQSTQEVEQVIYDVIVL